MADTKVMQHIICIKLPSFVRRTQKTELLKACIQDTGANLLRIGRSRNWQLQASLKQLLSLTTYLEKQQEQSWLWLYALCKAEYQRLSHDDLITIASSLPTLTISGLVTLTDCTLAQARKIIDDIEALD